MEQTTLYYRSGTSDKQYQVRLEKRENGFVVNIEYGRRGAVQQTGSKTQAPVPYEAAKSIYERLLREKMAKGYTVGEAGVPYSHSENAGLATGIVPQLLNPVAEDEIDRLLADPHWWLQEKHDGERRLIRKQDDQAMGINRRGLQVDLPEHWAEDCRRCPHNFVIDGEAVGDQLHVFDLLVFDGKNLRQETYLERYLKLMHLLSLWGSRHLRLVKTICLHQEKERFFQALKAQGAEGAVFKRIDAPYEPGRPASGGPALKFKFVESASFVVSRINDKRSVSLVLLDEGVAWNAGSVTIPTNHDIPAVGQVVEVRYLYAFPESGHVYQPVYLGVRADGVQEECTTSQLKYKSAPAEEIAA